MNNDCARDVLLEVEKIKFDKVIVISDLVEILKKYDREDIMMVISLFTRENILGIEGKYSYSDDLIVDRNAIRSLTARGKVYLDSIKSDELWEEMKSKKSDFNESSIFTIMELAKKITSCRENELFGLPKEYSSLTFRW